MLDIRPASTVDLESIMDILNHEIRFSLSNYSYAIMELNDVQKWFEHKNLHNFPVIVAYLNSKMVGFATYDFFRMKTGYKHSAEHSVYISKGFRKMGYGKLLLTKIIDEAKDRQIHTLIAGIDSTNISSIELHKQMKFSEVGYIKESAFKFDQWLDLVFMQLIL